MKFIPECLIKSFSLTRTFIMKKTGSFHDCCRVKEASARFSLICSLHFHSLVEREELLIELCSCRLLSDEPCLIEFVSIRRLRNDRALSRGNQSRTSHWLMILRTSPSIFNSNNLYEGKYSTLLFHECAVSVYCVQTLAPKRRLSFLGLSRNW